MMQDNYNDFDRQIRAALENAELKPSRRNWKKISARLGSDSRESASAYRQPIGWAFAGIAFAALAAGVFFSTNSEREIYVTRGALTAETTQVVTPLPGSPAALSSLPLHRVSAEQSLETVSVVIEEDQTVGNTGEEAKAETGSAKTSTGPSKGTYTYGGGSYDIFVTLDDTKERYRPSISSVYAKGILSGNDPSSMNNTQTATMAPGVSTGISELSTSSYGIPLTLGVGVRVYFLPRLSMGVGVDYSLLTRTFTGTYTALNESGTLEESDAGNVKHTLQYVGIPVNLYFDIIGSDKIKFYIYAGGTAELCVGNKYTLYTNPRISHHEPVERLAYSVGGGLGVEFTLTNFLSLYLDPGVRYYFNTDQPKSVRTDKPLMLNFDAGLRFNI